jgi:dienelactone hydrolase
VTSDAAPAPPAPTAVARDLAVVRRTITFTDASRARTLVTAVWAPAPSAQRYPLIVFGHGFGVAPEIYERLLRRWAAAGYVVAAPRFPRTVNDAPGGPDLADYPNQPADLSFVIHSMLSDPQVDPERVGVAGQSLGAMTALATVANSCCRDPSADAAVVLAGDMRPVPAGRFFGPARDDPPILFVHGDADTIVAYNGGRAAFEATPAPAWFLTVLGADHGGPYVLDPAVDADASVTAAVTVDFWDATLKGQRRAFATLRADAVAGGVARLDER